MASQPGMSQDQPSSMEIPGAVRWPPRQITQHSGACRETTWCCLIPTEEVKPSFCVWLAAWSQDIGPVSGNFRRCPLPRYPMSFQLKVFFGGEVVKLGGLGQGCCSRWSLRNLGQDDHKCWIQCNSVWRTSLSRFFAALQAGRAWGIHYMGWKVWTEPGFYSCLWNTQSRWVSKEKAHFIRFQGRGLWVSKTKRKYVLFKLCLDYCSPTRYFLFEMISFASFCHRTTG